MDGGLVSFVVTVREFLYRTLPDRWVERREMETFFDYIWLIFLQWATNASPVLFKIHMVPKQ